MSDDEYGYEGDEYGGNDDDGGGGADDSYGYEEPDDGNYQEQGEYEGEEYYEEPEPEEGDEDAQNEDEAPEDSPADEQEHDDGEAHDQTEEYDSQEYQGETESYDYHDDPTLAEDEAPPAMAQTNEAGNDDAPAHLPIDFSGMVKGALDGFGGGSIGDIMGTIDNITSGSGGLTNIMASGGLAALASGLIANAAHQFLNINPDTGRIIGSIAGNLIFNMGGQHNSLSDIGKIVLDNIISGKFKRDVREYIFHQRVIMSVFRLFHSFLPNPGCPNSILYSMLNGINASGNSASLRIPNFQLRIRVCITANDPSNKLNGFDLG